MRLKGALPPRPSGEVNNRLRIGPPAGPVRGNRQPVNPSTRQPVDPWKASTELIVLLLAAAIRFLEQHAVLALA